ncbi:prolyl oligopeptidase family serine peptidase [Pendulispora brunnea]|uniref:Prolyl oligopeptidase family serine peptidase n=1 Tax=Pendulispora brunnea TaxID=2905690 RepID=A0ABZ2KQ76_9BACT
MTSTGTSPIQANADPDTSTGEALAREKELAKKAAPILDAFSNREPVLTPDGKKVVFVSNRDGIPQLYLGETAHPETPATRVLSSSERAMTPLVTRDGKTIVFGSDRDADEQVTFFRADLDGKNLVQLTPNDRLQRDTPQLPAKAQDTLYFSGRTAVNSALAGVYTTSMSPAKTGPAPSKWVYQDANGGQLVDVSRDGKWGLFNRFREWSDNQIALVDLERGTASTLYPLLGQRSRVGGAAFSPDGARVFVATDGGAEQAIVLVLDTKSGKELRRYVETEAPKATIEGITVAPGGNVLALTLNAGNHSELRLLDTRTLEPKTAIKMPLGQGYASNFSNDGSTLSAVWSTPQAPQDVFAIETKTGASKPLRNDARASLDGLQAIETASTEVESDGVKVPVHTYLPAGGANQKRPVIVWFHGGPSDSSMVRWSPLARFFVSLGYAWVEPNIRGSAGFGRAYEAADNGPKRLDSFRDVEAVGRWVQSQPWADGKKMVAFGASYGGYVVLSTLIRQPSLWAAGVDMFGIANFNSFMASTSGPVRENYRTEIGDPDKEAAFLDSISPLRDAGKISAPLFVYAGKNDPRVPKAESDQIVKALRQHKSPVEYMVKDDEGHGIVRRDNQVEFASRVARFLETHLNTRTK